MIELLTTETMLSAIVGALAGSGASYFLTTIRERRKQTREARQAITAELATIGYNYMATLQELQAAKESGETGSMRSFSAQLTRLDGNLVAIQTRLWNVFLERRVRAALSRLLSRSETVTRYLSDQTQSSKDADTAISWFGKGLQELMLQGAAAARVPLRDPGGITWVGFRKATPGDRRILSFEDEPAPWKFNVSFDFTRNDEPDLLEKARCNMDKRAGALRCKVHNRAAHIILYGKDIHKFDIQIGICCQEFGTIVGEALGLNREKALIVREE